MTNRCANPPRSFAAILVLALSLMSLVMAPVLAKPATARTHEMAMVAKPAGSVVPCEVMDGQSNHAGAKQTQSCLAQCLAGHGALLPEMPALQTAWHNPAAISQSPPTPELPAHSCGLDPPPPRYA